MRLWLKKNSEVPLREQLVAQIILGIVSDDLKAGQRLPSTRDLARRYRIHANTVSAAYRELARRSWVELRKGSGIYVRLRDGDEEDSQGDLDQLISKLFRATRDRGYSVAELQANLKRWLKIQPPDHFLLIESDAELRAILASEIENATGAPVTTVSIEACEDQTLFNGALPLALYGQLEKVRARLPSGTELIAVRSRSVAESMRGQARPPRDALVAVVSRWPEFLRWSRAMLIAAGVDADALTFSDARRPGWKRGLGSTALIITDTLTASELPDGRNCRVFQILSDASREELIRYAHDLGISRR
jgi:DNA-binding transcriptional regulator YhcF (GntR family)